jgi:hypothetical protein
MGLPRFPPPLPPSPLKLIENSKKGVANLSNGIKTIRSGIKTLSDALHVESYSYVAPKPSVAQSKPLSGASDVATVIPAKVIEVPTEEETVKALQDRLREQITGAEDDLVHKLKINGKACTCLEGRHNVQAKALAREVMEKDPDNPLYQKVIDWFNTNEPIMTAKASASGQYDEKYIVMAGELGNFRRALTKALGQASPSVIQPVADFLKEQGK